MKTSEESFENDLRRMPPTAPSRRFRSSIAEELNAAVKTSAHSAPNRRWAMWLPWFVAGASASVAAAVLFRDVVVTKSEMRVSISQPANAWEVASEDEMLMVPVDSSGMLLVALDEGIVYLDSGQPARKVRLQFVDTVRLRNPGAAAALEITTPREEVRFVPVDTL